MKHFELALIELTEPVRVAWAAVVASGIDQRPHLLSKVPFGRLAYLKTCEQNQPQ